MQILARGWKRDHGSKTIAEGELATAKDHDGVASYYQLETSVQVLPPQDIELGPNRVRTESKVRVLMAAKEVALNGDYQFIVEHTKSDIFELFVLVYMPE